MVKKKSQSFLEYAFLWGIIAVALSVMWVYMRNGVTAKAEDMRQDVNLAFRAHEETTPFGYDAPDSNVVNWDDVVKMVNKKILSRYEHKIASLNPAGTGQSTAEIANNAIGMFQGQDTNTVLTPLQHNPLATDVTPDPEFIETASNKISGVDKGK